MHEEIGFDQNFAEYSACQPLIENHEFEQFLLGMKKKKQTNMIM